MSQKVSCVIKHNGVQYRGSPFPKLMRQTTARTTVATSTMNADIVKVAKNGKFWNDHLYRTFANIDVHAAHSAKPIIKNIKDKMCCSLRIDIQPWWQCYVRKSQITSKESRRTRITQGIST